MRYLIISLSFLLLSCGSYPKKNGFESLGETMAYVENPYFSNRVKDYVYKAKIEAFDKFFGGIFIIKKLGKAHHRIVFTTEMGNKLFDFTLHPSGFKTNYVLPEMNKKVFINLLKSDLKILVREKSIVFKGFTKNEDSIHEIRIVKPKKERLFYFIRNQTLNKIIKVKGGKEKVKFIFSEINDNIVGKIQIMHNNIPLKINLNAI